MSADGMMRALRELVPWAVIVSVPLVLLVWMIFEPPPKRIRVACDSAVAALLSATDIVALERAKFLIEHLRCSMANRLPDPTP